MSSSIPQLTLFPLYPGGPLVRGRSGLNGNSSFYLRETKFTPAYGVNIPANATPLDTTTYYTLNGNQRVVSRPISEAANDTGLLAYDGTAIGKLKQGSVPAVAPSIPNLYKNAVELLSVSDLKFSDLMAQPDFLIPGVGMGLKVTTDGMGGVDTIALSPSSRGQLPGVSAIAKDFTLPNRVDITTGATFFRTGPSVNIGGASTDNTAAPARSVNPINQQGNVIPPFNVNSLERNAGIFRQDQLEQLALQALADPNADLDRLSPLLERLYQPQPNEQGVSVAGYDSVLDAEQSRQLAANQARLGVNPSDQFRKSVAEFVSVARQPQESYSAAYNPRMDQLQNGKINVTPWQASANASQSGLGQNSGNAFEMGSAVADAMSRKGRGSYIPFRMQSDTQGGQQGFTGSNPFAGSGGGMQSGMSFGSQAQSHQQFRMPRRPMAFMA